MDRKNFIKVISAGTVCGGLLSLLEGCVSYRYVNASHDGEKLALPRSVFGEDRVVLVRNPGRKSPIYLRINENGEITALLLECTHKQCTVNPRPEQLACPCHGSRFSLDGEVMEGPARENLFRYDVEKTKDEIFIELFN